MEFNFNSFINGEFNEGEKRLDITNPATLKSAGTVASLSADDIDLAYKSARKAQKNWEKINLVDRIEMLNQFRNQMVFNRETMAEIMMAEVAKAKKECLNEIDRTIELIDYTFSESIRIEPQAFEGDSVGSFNKIGLFSRVAKGVICAISPFNYPVNLALAKIIPALVMGNTVVFKPATQGSLIGSYFGIIASKCDIPAGVFNVVTGRGSEIGDIITSHKEIDMISFTGSAGIGNRLKTEASTNDLVLELGGKDPAIIIDDLNIDKYAKDIVKGAFSYSGQRCTAIKRVLTTDKIADKLVIKLKEEVEKLSVGLPEQDCDITPVIDEKSASYVLGLIDDAIKHNAKAITGNKNEKNLIYPTLVDHVSVDCKLAWEEPFGPVLPIIRVKDIDQAIELANKSEFGLQASVYGVDINYAIRIAKQLDCGSVNINSKPQRGPDKFPFVGVKNSGFGTQGIKESLLSMSRLKGLVINY